MMKAYPGSRLHWLWLAGLTFALGGRAGAGNVAGFAGVDGTSITHNIFFPATFSGGVVSMAFDLHGLGPAVLLFDAVVADEESPDPDDLFFLNLVNLTGADLSRIDIRLGELPAEGAFSEGFGSVFGSVVPVLDPPFFFPDQVSDPAGPTTHGGVLVPFWPAGMPATLHFSVSVFDADHQLAMWVDVTPVPEPGTAAMLLVGATAIPLMRSRRIEKPHRHAGQV